MDYIILSLQAAGFPILLYCIYKLWKKILFLTLTLQQVLTSIDKIHLRIDKIFTLDAPSPNDAVKVNTNEIDLSTTDFQVPHDVRLDIEGGDGNVPPEFKEKK